MAATTPRPRWKPRTRRACHPPRSSDFVVHLESDSASPRERGRKAAAGAVTQRPPEVVANGVGDRPAELQGAVADGSAGGIEMTTRGLPSGRATIALPVATAYATTLFASARYSS